MILIGYDRRTNRRIAYNPRPGSALLGALFAALIGGMAGGVFGWVLIAIAALATWVAIGDIFAWFRVFSKRRGD